MELFWDKKFKFVEGLESKHISLLSYTDAAVTGVVAAAASVAALVFATTFAVVKTMAGAEAALAV